MTETSLKHFHECIIAFITTEFRLSKWHWISTWRNFHYEYCCRPYADKSSEEIKTEFQDVILPKVFTYDLTYEQRRKLESLATYQVCGPKLQMVPDGFVLEPIATAFEGAHSQINEGIDFLTNLSEDTSVASVLVDSKTFDSTKCDSDGNINVRKCISLLLQDETERFQESLLTWAEIKRRFQSKHQVARAEDIIHEARLFEKLQKGSRWHMQKKMATCLGARQIELRYRSEVISTPDFSIGSTLTSTSRATGFRINM